MAKNKRPQGNQPQFRHPAPAPTTVAARAPAQIAAASDKAQLDGLLSTIERERNSRAVVYWTSDLARMSDAVTIPLFDQLTKIGKTDRLDLILVTRGGDTEVPWRIVSLIREYTSYLGVLLPFRAASSGTLTALGADEIVMTPLAVLGPIDPSRTHPLLPRPSGGEPEPVSVQDMRHAMQFIREAAGGDREMPYTPEAMAQIFTALFDKLHPLAIGAIEQAYALSKLIGTRCLETHMDGAGDEAKIRSIVDTLCDDYKSHQYQISRREARDIGLNAVDAPDPVEKALLDIYKLYSARPVMPQQQPTAGTPFPGHIAWLDSTDLKMRVEGQYTLDSQGALNALGDVWVPY